MVKEGPCRHCGVTSTPLWRNGPPDKPILCNACGSRWRTKGNLTNYTPLNARLKADDYGDYNASSTKRKETKAPKRKKSRNNEVVVGDVYDYRYSYQKCMDDDSSYRSSSGSDESNSESFGPFSSNIESDSTGPEQSFVWDTTMPSRKRTCNDQSKTSIIEKLSQDLYTIFQEQQSYCSEAPEELLIYSTDMPTVSVEIGHGSVLIRHPSDIAHEEESEASSLSADIKPLLVSKDALHPVSPFVNTESMGQAITQTYRSELTNVHDIHHLLERRNSPLCNIDLNNIVNLEEFAAQFTTGEQEQLLKYLPKSDTEHYPYSLKHLLRNSLFRESSLSFQQLLGEGVLDLSLPNAKPEDCRNLRRLALRNLLKSHWVEQYNLLKMQKSHNTVVERNVPRSNVMEAAQLPQKSQTSDTKILLNNLGLMKTKLSNQTKEFVDTNNTVFTPNALSSSLITHPPSFDEGHTDPDLLFDVKSNFAFPLAELLHPSQRR